MTALAWPLLLLTAAGAFNVDTENCVRHRGAAGSMFGFSVAEHRERGESWVMVGAPEAQARSQPGVRRGGAVFQCRVDREDTCREMIFDRTPGNNERFNSQLDEKSHQWFGATVYSSGEDGILVACAPRYVWFSQSVNNTRRDPVGTCYVARNAFSDVSEYSPCRTRNWGHHRQGSCQAGLGAAISADGERLFIGAPGSWYWQGQLYSQSTYSRPEVMSTQEGPPIDDDSYLGYSVAVGDFSGGGRGDVAVGMPRGLQLVGKVVLYTWNLTNIQNISGEQLGSYFGYAMCAVDLDGDGLDDLVVGAPMHTDLSNNDGKYETGRVYVFYQGAQAGRFSQFDVRDGTNSKSRFGLALSSLGDINKDGFGDFAVGAPYDGPNERGAVYIYHGSRNGVTEKYSQRILAEDILSTLSTFGFSVSGGIDLDENEYPDLVVGAYEANTAVFLKSRPVVKVDSLVTFMLDQKQISLDEKNCTLRGGMRVTCVELNACLQYGGVGVDNRLSFHVQLVLDTKVPKSPRMYFLEHVNRNMLNFTFTLDKNVRYCRNYYVFILPEIRDKLTPLEAEIRYSLDTDARSQPGSSGRTRFTRSLAPIIDQYKSEFARDSINIQKNCGPDNVCIPDLHLEARPSVTQYLLGSGDRFVIEAAVENRGEDAFEAVYELFLPVGMSYINYEHTPESPVYCTRVNNTFVRCDVGNPLPEGKLVRFRVLLQPSYKEGMKTRYEFFMRANTSNPENDTDFDNEIIMKIPIQVEAHLNIIGSSHPPELHYNTSQFNIEEIKHESEIGPQVIHKYAIVNKGPSDLVETDIFILWPSHTLQGDNLLYLLEPPEVEEPIVCDALPEANALKLALLHKKSYLEESSRGEMGASNVAGESSSSSSNMSSSSSSSSGGSVTISSSSSSSYNSSSSSSAGSGGGGGHRHTVHASNGSSVVAGQGFAGHDVRTETLTEEEQRLLEEERRQLEEEKRRFLSSAGRVPAGGGGGSFSSSNYSASWSGSNNPAGHFSNYSYSNSTGGRALLASQRGFVPGESAAVGAHIQPAQENVLGAWQTNGQFRTGIIGSGGSRGASVNEQQGLVSTGSSSQAGISGGAQGRNPSQHQTWHSETHSSRSGSGGAGSLEIGGSGAASDSNSNQRFSQTQSSRSGSGSVGIVDSGRDGQTGEASSRNWSSETHVIRSGSRDAGGLAAGSDNGARDADSRLWSSGTRTTDVASAGGGYQANSNNREVAGSVSQKWSDTHTRSGTSTGNWPADTYERRGSGTSGGGWSSEVHLTGGRGSDRVYSQQPNWTSETHSTRTNTWSSADEGANDRTAVYHDRASSGVQNRGHSSAGSFSTQTGANEGHVGAEGVNSRGHFVWGEPGASSGGTYHVSSQNVDDVLRRQGSSATRQQQDNGYVNEYGSGSNSRRGQGGNWERTQSRSYELSYNGDTNDKELRHLISSQQDLNHFEPQVSTESYSYEQHYRSPDSKTQQVSSNSRTETRTYSHHASHSSDLTGAPDGSENQWLQRRHKRTVGDDELERLLKCESVNCTVIHCKMGFLAKDKTARMAFRARVWAKTIEKINYSNRPVKVSSMMVTRVARLPQIGEPEEAILKNHEVLTDIIPTDVSSKPEVVPLWVVVLSACAGALILLLLIFLLWKCGFFKRNRPTNSPEKEPLNRNGHYQGDEAL
ncbi:integrin alpha-PS2 isoform X2 [Bacillus rossius redtenbacheri]|uniref:integrin alpha-PS2 isoform X2 n=1 Tax=Bacillus rossius redtenbacheri TaxID=93214 RepID=UPI002FDD5929